MSELEDLLRRSFAERSTDIVAGPDLIDRARAARPTPDRPRHRFPLLAAAAVVAVVLASAWLAVRPGPPPPVQPGRPAVTSVTPVAPPSRPGIDRPPAVTPTPVPTSPADPVPPSPRPEPTSVPPATASLSQRLAR